MFGQKGSDNGAFLLRMASSAMNKAQYATALRRVRILQREIKRARKVLSGIPDDQVAQLLRPRTDELEQLRDAIARYER